MDYHDDDDMMMSMFINVVVMVTMILAVLVAIAVTTMMMIKEYLSIHLTRLSYCPLISMPFYIHSSIFHYYYITPIISFVQFCIS